MMELAPGYYQWGEYVHHLVRRLHALDAFFEALYMEVTGSGAIGQQKSVLYAGVDNIGVERIMIDFASTQIQNGRIVFSVAVLKEIIFFSHFCSPLSYVLLHRSKILSTMLSPLPRWSLLSHASFYNN